MRAVAFERDLNEIVVASEDDLKRFAGSRLYVTGGTGFVGTWLLRALAHANATLGTRIRLEVLTRDPDLFCGANPDIAAADGIRFLCGDVCSPVVDGTYDGVIHAAASSGAAIAPSETIRTVVDGTRAIIRDVVAPSGAIPVLFISSGAVYGRQPAGMPAVAEDFCGELNHLDPRLAYHESKRLAELCFAIVANESPAAPKIARLFAFLGPGLPLRAHFAAGNFIGDALAGGPIRVKSGGSAVRTYLYPTDMIAWCLAVFNRGPAGRAYNIGSDEAVTIGELARRIAGLMPQRAEVELGEHTRESAETRYVPDIGRVKKELGVDRSVSLDEAIRRTIRFYRESPNLLIGFA